MHTQLYIILHRQCGKQTNILEGTGNPRLIHLNGIHAVGVDAVQKDGAMGRLIYFGQQVKHRSFPCAVRTNQPGNLCAAYCKIEIIYRFQPAKLNS